MTIKSVASAVCVTLLAGITLAKTASAENLAEKRKHKEQMEYLQKEIDYTNEKCGVKITGSIDWTGSVLEDFDKYSGYGYCEEALSALESVCEDQDGKDAVKEKVKTFVCKFGKREVTLKEGTLTWSAEWESSNNADFVKEYLMKAL